jgi:hypothetical protein
MPPGGPHRKGNIMKAFLRFALFVALFFAATFSFAVCGLAPGKALLLGAVTACLAVAWLLVAAPSGGKGGRN